MQRHYEVIRDGFGNPIAGVSLTVYDTGTTTKTALYPASNTADNPSTVTTNPVVSGSDGVLAFAINDGDYDLSYSGGGITPYTIYRKNFFDSSTATSIPVSAISLAMPTEFAVTGSPGTSITVAKNTVASGYVYAGPTTGVAAAPTFRGLVEADVSPVAVALSGDQTIAGDKTFNGATTISGGLVIDTTGTTSIANDIYVTNDMSFGSSTHVIADPATKFHLIDNAKYGYKNAPFLNDGSTGAGTAPTITELQSGIRRYAFSASATNERIYHLTMPSDYAEGTDFYPYICWTTLGTNLGAVRWGMEYAIVNNDSQGAMPANTTIYVETAGAGTALEVVRSTFDVITGTGIQADSIIQCRMFRDGAHGNDAQTAVAFLLSFGIKYRVARPLGTKTYIYPFYS